MIRFTKTIVLTFLASPLISYANLDTYNYTNEDSSVRVTSGSIHPCSADVGVYTPKKNANGTPGHSSANNTQIKTLCISSENNTCTADIYNSKNCTLTKIGTASLNMGSSTITSMKTLDSRYTLEVQNGGRVLLIKYAS